MSDLFLLFGRNSETRPAPTTNVSIFSCLSLFSFFFFHCGSLILPLTCLLCLKKKGEKKGRYAQIRSLFLFCFFYGANSQMLSAPTNVSIFSFHCGCLILPLSCLHCCCKKGGLNTIGMVALRSPWSYTFGPLSIYFHRPQKGI